MVIPLTSYQQRCIICLWCKSGLLTVNGIPPLGNQYISLHLIVIQGVRACLKLRAKIPFSIKYIRVCRRFCHNNFLLTEPTNVTWRYMYPLCFIQMDYPDHKSWTVFLNTLQWCPVKFEQIVTFFVRPSSASSFVTASSANHNRLTTVWSG